MNKDEFAQAKYIIETHRAIHAGRKNLEFRIVIASLTFYIAAVAAMLTNKNNLPSSKLFYVLVAIGYFAIAITASIQFFFHSKANKINQRDIAEKVENKILEAQSVDAPDKHPMHFAWLWQTAIIFISAALSSAITWFLGN